MVLNVEARLSGLSCVKNSPVASFTGRFWRLYCLVSVLIRKERLFIYIVMIVYGEKTLLFMLLILHYVQRKDDTPPFFCAW